MSNPAKTVDNKAVILGALAEARAALAEALSKLDGLNDIVACGARSCIIGSDNAIAQNEAWAQAQEVHNVS